MLFSPLTAYNFYLHYFNTIKLYLLLFHEFDGNDHFLFLIIVLSSIIKINFIQINFHHNERIEFLNCDPLAYPSVHSRSNKTERRETPTICCIL